MRRDTSHGLPREYLLGSGAGRNVGLAVTNDQYRSRPLPIDIDAIKTRTRECDLRDRCIEANGILGLEHAHANDDASCSDEQREPALGEPRHVKIRVAREPDLAAAVVDFGAAAVIDPQVVALRDRIVEADWRPFAGMVIGRVMERPLHVRDAPDLRPGIIASLRMRRERDRAGEKRNQPSRDDGPARSNQRRKSAGVQGASSALSSCHDVRASTHVDAGDA
jgi:hypothetical protein